jgi:Spy/CpxP family protein refolding chaperone
MNPRSIPRSPAAAAFSAFSSPQRLQWLMATVVVAAAILVSAPAHAQPMGPMHGGPAMHGEMMGGPGMGRMLDKVNATTDQRSQIKAIMDAARTDLKALHATGRGLHQQMQAAFAQPTVDARAVETLRQQIQAQQDSASKRMTQALLDASKVLTPDQRKTLADLMAQRQAMAERHAAERTAMDKPAAK